MLNSFLVENQSESYATYGKTCARLSLQNIPQRVDLQVIENQLTASRKTKKNRMKQARKKL